MPTYTYPFVVTRPGDPARPYLPVTIVNPTANRRVSVYALIDTGADECALPAGFAVVLGHHLEAGETREVNTGNGSSIAYAHTTVIEAVGFSTKSVLLDYMPNLTTPLSGARSYLSTLRLTVDYPAKQFSLELPE
jgi:predicted aspartyl protease